MHKKTNIVANIKKLKPFVAPHKWGLIGAISMVVITNITLGLTPRIEGLITTRLLANVKAGNGVDFTYIGQIIALLGICYLIKTFSQVFGSIWLTNSIQNTMHDLRNAIQDKIRRLPVRYFDSHSYGDVLSRITNDIDAVSNGLQQSLTQIISGVLTLSMALVMMYMMDPMLAVIATLILPLSYLIVRFVVKRSQKQFKAQQDAIGELNGAVTELYTGYNEILLFNKQQESIEQFKVINEDLKNHAFRAQFMSSVMAPLLSLVTYLTIGTVAALGSIFVIGGRMTVGDLQAFIRYIWQVNDPISQVSQLSTQIQSAFAAMQRIFEVLEEEEEIKELEPPVSVAKVEGEVVFDHVNFGYGSKNLIQDLNVHVKSGQMVAIVGHTGAGKTTLINLLMRFYDVKGGRILIDGVDIRDMKREELRHMFGMVLQDTWLFSGTIYDNLRYGRLNARKDEIIDAAKMANVHHFIRTLPGGYNMEINEEGNNISQGEKQLLTIARAILKDPQILILDEATSSVDTRLEKMLQNAMQKVMKGRTSFVIAHRLSTIRNADVILVMKDGQIIEQGDHETLMHQHGHYEQLYNSQFSHQIAGSCD